MWKLALHPGEGPSRGLLHDCTTSPNNRLHSTIHNTHLDLKSVSDGRKTDVWQEKVCDLRPPVEAASPGGGGQRGHQEQELHVRAWPRVSGEWCGRGIVTGTSGKYHQCVVFGGAAAKFGLNEWNYGGKLRTVTQCSGGEVVKYCLTPSFIHSSLTCAGAWCLYLDWCNDESKINAH